MIELNVAQGSNEWHAARAKCFNASEAPAMMGVSPYMTRTELLRQKATGIVPEVDAATQRLFDAGHEAEAGARPHVEGMIGEELYPIVATDDAGRLLASSDGATMLCNIGFEHKLWNEKIAAEVAEGNVPESHRWQLDQQFAVFGFDKIAFVCSDGTPEKFVYCWYYPQPERIANLRAGWDQFEKDLAEYQHVEAKPAVVADTIEDLPALTVQLVGQVTASNLDTFKNAVTVRIQAINTALVTDADFANADKMVKFLDDGEKRLDLVKAQALAQTESIDTLFRTIDALKAEMRSKRLTLDKLVKAEKDNRKNEIVSAARSELIGHVQNLHSRIEFSCIQIDSRIFAEAIKGLKSLDSMRDKVSVALANAKIEANAVADRIEYNQKQMQAQSAAVLFPDFAQVCTKAQDDFAALVAMRVAAKKEADEKLLAEQREKIRAEEQAKAQSEADSLAAAGSAEANRIAAEELRKIDLERKEKEAQTRSQPTSTAAIETQPGAMLKLGEINAMLAPVSVNADGLASLGILPVAHEKNAKLYDANKFPTICRLISEHVMAQAFKKAA